MSLQPLEGSVALVAGAPHRAGGASELMSRGRP